MKTTLKLSDYRAMSPSDKQKSLGRLIQETRSQDTDEIARLDSCIAEFEQKHGFSSQDMRKKLSHGELPETNDVCKWSMLISMKNEIERSSNQ